MNVTLYGAALEVTGSCYLLRTANSNVLIDCGLFQGSQRVERQNYVPQELGAADLTAVILTHGHLDHCGRLPLLVKSGFRGPIFATEGTIDITRLILTDAARIQQDDAERENRKRAKNRQRLVTPLFDEQDIQKVFRLFTPVALNSRQVINDQISFHLVDAGHILGSASVVIAAKNGDSTKRLVFSGDLGPSNAPILFDPSTVTAADAVFLESTYGDRDHKGLPDTLAEFEEIISTGITRGGKILIPTFAVGRAQQMLYHLANLFRTGKVPSAPIFLDSPMAIAATNLYLKHPEAMDQDAGIFLNGSLDKVLPELKNIVTAEQSKSLNDFEGPCVILAGAGMCNAGRILHHLLRNLSAPETSVLIVGYQARGSLGRLLVEGAPKVKIFGETVPVRATVRGLGGFSAHAGQSELIKWLSSMVESQPLVFLSHGEPHPMSELASKIKQNFGITCRLPHARETLDI